MSVTITTPDGQQVQRDVDCDDDDREPPAADPLNLLMEAPGGGAGGSSNCRWVPAVEGVSGEVVPSVYQRVRADGVIETRYFTDCGPPNWVWVEMGSDPANLVPQVTPAMLIPEAYARVRRMLPTPIPRIAPADLAPDGFAFVQMPAFFWVDQGPGQWERVSATASLAGLSLTMTATPSMLLVDTGDGATLQCPSAPPYRRGVDPEDFRGCEHVYRDSSAMAPNGETFTVTVTIVWGISWQASNGESGVLDPLTTSANRDLPVAEIQAVMIDG